ncbi:hypothetical protein GCM10007108_02560 [Thermogymnomonas acidicola]|uniref:Uncharacterized protein n=1 Tax=Thermogymnomonas acidicola TaxID=399579 RepID=A0AA37BPW9_9ARCH|nr:hypothetical protein [Thermogymnomonas acidicola]GGM68006.1 hypothetical protein GCM10007108_02560 [Thermogymnomonas acidicola]
MMSPMDTYYVSTLSLVAITVVYLFFLISRPILRDSGAIRGIRTVLGSLWLLDGALQLQPFLSFFFTETVSVPSWPPFLSHIDSGALAIWNTDPIVFNTLAGGIQVMLGLTLLLRSEGGLFRAAAVGSIAWSVVVWVFGETMPIFQGSSILSGSPGAALLYGLMSVPLVTRVSPGKFIRYSMVSIFAISLLWQALPVDGFWSWKGLAENNYMLYTAYQPHALTSLMAFMTSLEVAEPVVVNSIVVASLAAAAVLWALRPNTAVYFTIPLMIAFWVLFQDFGGMFTGFGTDPNIALPLALFAAVSVMGGRAPVFGNRQQASNAA